jgi:hypothetical protein
MFYPVFEDVPLDQGEAPYQKKMMMQGMLNLESDELVSLAKSWIHPPALTNSQGCIGTYDKAQRAYILQPAARQFSFTLECSESSPLYNAAFIIKNWTSRSGASITVDGQESAVRQGMFRDVDGTRTLAIWLEKKAVKKVDIMIR